MGFLKFLLAVGLIIFGILFMVGSFFGGIRVGMANALFGSHVSSVSFWVVGIIGFVGFLGGVYMLRKK